MFTRLHRLNVYCKQSVEEIDFAHITWFHGQISSGKSTILKLVDFCFGGKLISTPALSSEFLSAELQVTMGTNSVTLQREKGHNQVLVDWIDKHGELHRTVAPVEEPEDARPLVGDEIFTLSDLLMHLHGLPPLKVKKNKYDAETAMVRLSIRDFLWFCYLAEVDQDCFRLDQDYKQAKARDVYRVIFGFYNHEISELERSLSESRSRRRELLAAAKQLEEFLAPHGFATTTQIQTELSRLEAQRVELQRRLNDIQTSAVEGHPVDRLQGQCRAAALKVQEEELALQDLQNQIERRTRVRAELVMATRKIDRVEVAESVLGHVDFADCPACGQHLAPRLNTDCIVCGQPKQQVELIVSKASERRLLSERIAEIDGELEVLSAEVQRQQRRVKLARDEKMGLDARLEAVTRQYDPPKLAMVRELENELGSVNGQIGTLDRMSSLPQEVEELRAQAARLQLETATVESDLKLAKDKAVHSLTPIREYEETFLRTLMNVNFPQVTQQDEVELDYGRTWKMYVYPRKDRELRWCWENAGSNGKKTLYNTCLALALHHTTSTYNLPLPTFIMVDSPMKNIGKDVNKDIMLAFYEALYRFATGTLSSTQIVIVDKEFVPPPADLTSLSISERLMTDNDPLHPPLIRYYHGH